MYRNLLPIIALSSAVAPAGAQTQEVVVYSSRSHYGAEKVFEDFTRETGIAIRFFTGNNNEVIERLRAEGERTTADVLLTVARDIGNGLDNFALLAIPFFVLAGDLMGAGGLARRLIDLASALVGQLRAASVS